MENLKLSSEFFYDHPALGAVLRLIFLITLSFPFLSILVFPFYVHVNRKNRKRDELVAIFPFTDYFYRVTCFTESSTILLIVSSGVLFLIDKLISIKTFEPIVLNSAAALMAVKINVAVVFNILISILSFYRFFLYFFPRTIKFEALSKKSIVRLAIASHVLVLFVVISSAKTILKDHRNSLDQFGWIIVIVISGLEIIATLPYFLMILSIRKLSRLTTNRQSTPETYIKYQIVIIFISKLLILPFYLFVETVSRPEDNVNTVLIMHLLYETMTMPLMVQVAYLLSNKTNWETLKRTLTWGNAFKNQLRQMYSRVYPKRVYTITTGQVETKV